MTSLGWIRYKTFPNTTIRHDGRIFFRLSYAGVTRVSINFETVLGPIVKFGVIA